MPETVPDGEAEQGRVPLLSARTFMLVEAPETEMGGDSGSGCSTSRRKVLVAPESKVNSLAGAVDPEYAKEISLATGASETGNIICIASSANGSAFMALALPDPLALACSLAWRCCAIQSGMVAMELPAAIQASVLALKQDA
jgi:hypothetical protein